MERLIRGGFIAAIHFLVVASPLHAGGFPRAIYAGSVADSIHIIIRFDSLDADQIGACFHGDDARETELGGGMFADGTVRLNEYNLQTGELAGSFRGQFDAQRAVLQGEWFPVGNARRLPFKAERVAGMDSVGEEWTHGAVHFTFSMIYPQFLPSMGPAYAALNDSIEGLADAYRRDAHAWFMQMMSGVSGGSAASGPAFEVGSDVLLNVVFLGPGLVSLTGQVRHDGGLHPWIDFPAFNYRLSGHDAAPIEPASVFRSGSGYRSRLARLIFAALRRSRYACMRTLTPATFDRNNDVLRFAVVARGLLFTLWPGGASCGPADDIVVPYAGIRSLIDPHGPLAVLVR